MHSFIILTVLAAVGYGHTILESQRITNWGKFHPWKACPDGTLAYAFRLKTEAPHRQGMLKDDTGLNAIELYCEGPKEERSEKFNIISGEGKFGKWGAVHNCTENARIIGFELKMCNSRWGDDVSACNLAVLCSDGTRVEGDGFSKWEGKWYKSEPASCGEKTAVCGIRSQIEEYQGADVWDDDTALNNVEMACCKTAYQITIIVP